MMFSDSERQKVSVSDNRRPPRAQGEYAKMAEAVRRILGNADGKKRAGGVRDPGSFSTADRRTTVSRAALSMAVLCTWRYFSCRGSGAVSWCRGEAVAYHHFGER